MAWRSFHGAATIVHCKVAVKRVWLNRGPGVTINGVTESVITDRGRTVKIKTESGGLTAVAVRVGPALMLAAAGFLASACAAPTAPADATAPAGTADSGAPADSGAGLGGLHDIVWQWESVTDQTTRAVTSVPEPAGYTLVLRTDGTLSGQADCNSFTGTYLQENGFHIEVGAVTEAFCGEESMDGRYLDMLAAVVAGGPDGAGGLALETAGGAERMLFANGGGARAP